MGLAHLHPYLQSQLHCATQAWFLPNSPKSCSLGGTGPAVFLLYPLGSPPPGPALMIPRQGSGPVLRSAAACEGQGQHTCSHDPGPALLTIASTERQEGALLPSYPYHFMGGRRQSLLNHTLATRARFTVLPGQGGGPAFLNAAAASERWSQLYRLLLLVRAGVTYAQILDIHMVPNSCPNQTFPYTL